MNTLKSIWRQQDVLNRILLILAFGLCIFGIMKGEAALALALLVVLCVLAVTRNNNRIKRLSRLYGALFFHMPDGEIYPMSFEQVKAEYTHGQQYKYKDRRVTVRFPYHGLDEAGDVDTGFGLKVRAAQEHLQPWKRGQLLAATGVITAVSSTYFCIDRVEEIRLTTEKEDLTVSAQPSAEEHKSQEEHHNEIHD